MAWTVYEHITPSGKRYIGITSRANPKKRWGGGSQYHKGTAFRGAIDKYGWNDIQHNIVSSDLTEKEAKWLENYLICYYWTFVGFKNSKGYNMTLGGEGCVGYVPNEETRCKQSEAKKCNQYHKGKHHSEETCKKISYSLKGHTPWNSGIQTDEKTKLKISDSMKGHTPWNSGKKTGISPGNKGKKLVMIDGKRHYE